MISDGNRWRLYSVSEFSFRYCRPDLAAIHAYRIENKKETGTELCIALLLVLYILQ